MNHSSKPGYPRDHLFSSENGLLRIIDIPISIACAQQIDSQSNLERLICSTRALDRPYPSIEPKSEKAKANVVARLEHETLERNRSYEAFIRNSLDEIKQSFVGEWTTARFTKLADIKNGSVKRKFESSVSEHDSWDVGDSIPPCNIFTLENGSSDISVSTHTLRTSLIHNPHGQRNSIMCNFDARTQGTYWIPPQSVLCQGRIDQQTIVGFEVVLEQLFSESSYTAGPGQLDIILMDPPWNNRSASRSDQYQLMDERKNGPLCVVSEALPRLLASGGLLAMWITNKASTRHTALGIFRDLGIEGIEEWIWIKVTSAGEPVYQIDGLYRQPWETCLVGKRGAHASNTTQTTCRRLMAACPDLHSRKPAIGRMLVDHYNAAESNSLRKLEIFARYASAGWCAWGNEALKFNDETCWTDIGHIDLESTRHKDSNSATDNIVQT